MNYRVFRTALPVFGLLLTVIALSGCNKSSDPGAEAGSTSGNINTPGGAVSAPPEVKSQIQAAEQAESAKRAAHAGQQPK